MSVAEWFFSTLAQSTAAIIGFTIALAAALYTSRLEKIRHQTEALRSRLIDIKDEYRPVLSGVSTTILDQGDFSTGEITPDIDGPAIIEESEDTEEAFALIRYLSRGLDASTDEIEAWAEDQSDEQAAIVWAHARRAGGILEDISPLNENLLEPQQMRRLLDSVKALKETLNAGTDSSEEFYQEITGEDPSSSYHTEDIFSESQSIERWLDRNLEDLNRRRVGFEIPESIATGRNISNWATVFEEFERDVGLASGSAIGTKVITDPRKDIKSLLLYAAVLGIVGIFVPLLFLITSQQDPIWMLSSDLVLLSQVMTLTASAILSGLLIRALFGFLRKSMT